VTLAAHNGVLMSFAVLYLPPVAEFGGSRGEVAAAQSVSLLLGGFTGPLVGAAFDRFGPRRLFQGSACGRARRGEPCHVAAAAGPDLWAVGRARARPARQPDEYARRGVLVSVGARACDRAADLFAGASFGAIWGWLTLAVRPGEALGGRLGGKVFDVWGSYFPAFGFVWLTLAAGVVSMWRVRPAPRDPGSARVR